jgi:hypothetical protein
MHRQASRRQRPDHSSTASEPDGAAVQTPTVDDVCRALEQSAAENALPVEFFARVIWQGRFDARAVRLLGRTQFYKVSADTRPDCDGRQSHQSKLPFAKSDPI